MSSGANTATLTVVVGLMLGAAVVLPRPSAIQAQTPATPVVRECTVAPLESPVWDQDVIAEPTAPVSVEGPFTPPTGDPVDEETLAGVTATIEESIACQNAGDVARTLALFTPDAVRGFFSGPRGYDSDRVDATIAAGPVPVTTDRVLTLVSIGDVVVLSDGRVGASVTTSTADVEYVDYLTLTQGMTADGAERWLIAGSVAIDSQTQVDGEATTIP